jgi:hypothetical protein
MSAVAPARSPFTLVLLSSAGAAAALTLALTLTRPETHDPFSPNDASQLTPERAAESFIDAYINEDYARAAGTATPAFARSLRARPKHAQSGRADTTLSWLLQESHVLPADKLRFVGVLLHPGEEESAGRPVTLTLLRRDGRYRVDELHWPKGPPDAHNP